MRHVQHNSQVTVTMTTDEWLAFSQVRSYIDQLYAQYFLQGKTPGMLEAPGIWKRIMEAWGAFRREQGLR